MSVLAHQWIHIAFIDAALERVDVRGNRRRFDFGIQISAQIAR
jgi:hypothetical protein